MNENLKQDYIWNTIGVLAQNAISPILLIVITQLNGIHDSGTFSFTFSVAIMLWAIGIWGGRTFQASDIKQEFTHQSYIAMRVVLGVVMLIFAVLFSLLNGYSAEKTGILFTLTLFKAIESVADALYGILQVHGRLYITGKSLLYKAICGFGLFMAIDIVTGSILLSSIGIVAANILFVISYDIPHVRNVERVHFKRNEIKRYAIESMRIIRRTSPVFAVLFLSMFALNIPRYFIDKYQQPEIGYFGILAMPITLIALVMTFVLQPRVVFLSASLQQRNFSLFRKTVRQLSVITTGIGIGVILVTMAVGVPVLQLVFGVNFSNYKGALLVLVAGGVLSALVSVLINIMIIMRKFKFQFYTLILTNSILILLCIRVVPQYGLKGAVSLFAFTTLIQLLCLYIFYICIVSQVSKNPQVSE